MYHAGPSRVTGSEPDPTFEAPVGDAIETAVREYQRTRDYERDIRSRRREGWRVVSVLQRPGKPARLRRIAVGSGLAKPETEYLVTYNRPYQHHTPPRPLTWLLNPALVSVRPRRWAWLAVGLLLTALLAYGFIDFFADAVPF